MFEYIPREAPIFWYQGTTCQEGSHENNVIKPTIRKISFDIS